MTCRTYILIDGKPVPEPDGERWAAWIRENRHTTSLLRSEVNDSLVSTVFVGQDYRERPEQPMELWETAILKHHGRPWLHTYYKFRYVERHTSQEDAERRHGEIVAKLLSNPADHGLWPTDVPASPP